MLKAYFRRIHRWLALLFALPLLIVVATGLVLSFEPLIQQARPERPITLPTVEQALARFDPQNTARSLGLRTLDHALTIGGAGRGGGVTVDLQSGEQTAESQRVAQFLVTARRLHEALLLDLGWLVAASTFAMLAIVALGLLMGWPRFRNSLGGWHQGAAWLTLPLIILSPFSGLALVYGITFMPPLGRATDGGRVSMTQAVSLVAAEHDLKNLTSIRQRGNILMARIFVDGELRAYRIAPSGLQPLARNWPRVVHEGNWGGVVGPLLNVLTSLVLLGLLATGFTIWLRQRARKLSARNAAMRGARGPATIPQA
jgi:uncharacterized iron-regulated membrane protein